MLLFGQTAFAFVAGACLWLLSYPGVRRSDDRALRHAAVLFLALSVVGFLAVFTTHDLNAYDYSS